MTIPERQLHSLMRHTENVRVGCEELAEKLLDEGEDFEFCKRLVLNGRIHDVSKYEGVEWDHLWNKGDPLFGEALAHHIKTNPHHPEFWGSIHDMERLYIPEMVIDWQARSYEFGTSLTDWIENKATQKWAFDKSDKIFGEISYFLHFVLEPAFA